MFKRSFFLVSLVFMLVFASAFASQIWMTRDLPSSYDTGLTIEKAFKTSKAPLLIEFYSDSCATCKRLTPVIHALEEGPYQGRLTLVMLDVSEGANQDIARLFGVDSLPALYVFDHHHMKKHAIQPEDFTSQAKLQKALDEALALSNAHPASATRRL